MAVVRQGRVLQFSEAPAKKAEGRRKTVLAQVIENKMKWSTQSDVYSIVGVVKSVFTAPPRTLLAMRAGSRIKGAPLHGAFIVDPLTPQPALACFDEILQPLIVDRWMNSLAAAQIGHRHFGPDPFHHDADLLFGGKSPAGHLLRSANELPRGLPAPAASPALGQGCPSLFTPRLISLFLCVLVSR